MCARDFLCRFRARKKTARFCRRNEMRGVRIRRWKSRPIRLWGRRDRIAGRLQIHLFVRRNGDKWIYCVLEGRRPSAKGSWKSAASKELRETILLLNFRVQNGIRRDASVSGEERFKTAVWTDRPFVCPVRKIGGINKTFGNRTKFVLKLFFFWFRRQNRWPFDASIGF